MGNFFYTAAPPPTKMIQAPKRPVVDKKEEEEVPYVEEKGGYEPYYEVDGHAYSCEDDSYIGPLPS